MDENMFENEDQNITDPVTDTEEKADDWFADTVDSVGPEQTNSQYYGGQTSGQYNSNPYASTEPERGPSGKRTSIGFGVASMVLGIISLLCFCTCFNIITGIIAIILGIIQIVTCERKDMAIVGIVTAAISILLFVVGIALFTANTSFTHMMQDEMLDNFTNGRDFFEENDLDYFLDQYQDTL